MAKAYQCDRCMQYYTENKEIPMGGTDTILSGIKYVVKKAGQDPKDGRNFELCDDCLKKIYDFMGFRADFVPKENKPK